MDGDANYGIVYCANCAAIAEREPSEDGRKEGPSELAIDLAARLLNNISYSFGGASGRSCENMHVSL